MRSLKTSRYLKTASKGFIALLAIKALLVVTVLLVQSCKKPDAGFSSGKEKENFIAAINRSQGQLGSTIATSVSKFKESFSEVRAESEPLTTKRVKGDIFLAFPDDETSGLDLERDVVSIKDLSTLVMDFNATIQYSPSETNHAFSVPLSEVVSNLNPLIIESKAYLNAKGFSNAEIDQMVIDSAAHESDLVAFVMLLASYEQQTPTAYGIRNFFGSQANAQDVSYKDYIRCGVIALGGDALWALGTSNASKWSKQAMRTAFGAVAKKMVGPIGVTIAVITFGVCIAETYLR